MSLDQNLERDLEDIKKGYQNLKKDLIRSTTDKVDNDKVN